MVFLLRSGINILRYPKIVQMSISLGMSSIFLYKFKKYTDNKKYYKDNIMIDLYDMHRFS